MTKSSLGKQERALQFGLDTDIQLQSSFEMNQSCPSYLKPKLNKKLKTSLNQFINFTGEEIDSCCYSKGPSELLLCDLDKSKSRNGSRPVSSLSFNASWSSIPESSFLAVERSNFNYKTSHKAILTIDAKTEEVLTANKQACVLFEHTSDSLIHLKLADLFKKPHKNSEKKIAAMHDVCGEKGNVTIYSGKVMEIITKLGNEIPVSVWMRKYDGNENKSLCVVVLQPVSRITGNFSFNDEGIIQTCDDDFAYIHGHPNATSLKGVNLVKLMPSYNLPVFGSRLAQDARKQYTTSTTVDGIKIPISVYILSQQRNDQGKIFTAVAWFFSNVGGPLTVNSSGIIQNVNSNFSLALLGYTSSQLQNKSILHLLPGLADDAPNRSCLNSVSEDTPPLSQSSDPFCVNSISPSDGDSDSRSSFVNISLSNSSHGNDTVSNPCSALDRINSLLLGKITPSGTPKTKSSSKESDSYGCAFGQKVIDDSWVEISLDPDQEENDSRCDVQDLGRINSPLNGNDDSVEAEQATSSDKSPDSAVHSSSYAIDDRAIAPCRSQLSDYQSASSLTENNREYDNDDKENDATTLDRSCDVTRKHCIINDVNVTSTPLNLGKRRSKVSLGLTEGHFEGYAVHKDGSMIPVTYEVRCIQPCGMHCVWINLVAESSRSNSSRGSNQTLSSSFNSTLPSLNASIIGGAGDYSLGSIIKQAAQKLNESAESVFSPREGTDEWLAVQGKFNEVYEVKKAVGSGAFGFVRMARHRKTNKRLVVKFIRKEKVLEECWVDDYETDSLIPLEIALLAKFNHPNIINVVDFYENDNFFAMLMPTHGVAGIDLFEFIDREPLLNELLASYIFRQIAAAVYFLDGEGVVHRDLKDENVIIDEGFTCKLIDFGSAAFYKKGKTFSTFCGTVEYCSPEVLLGEKYEGPALEVWALGVTLYTLVYGENPFRDIDETIQGKLVPPHLLSSELMSLIRSMLQPVPEHRCSIKYVMEHDWVDLPVDISLYSWEKIVPPAAPKQSFQNTSSTSASNHHEDNFKSNNDSSLLSSRETLAEHIRKWNEEAPSRREGRNENVLPLTRRLENINLNHSV